MIRTLRGSVVTGAVLLAAVLTATGCAVGDPDLSNTYGWKQEKVNGGAAPNTFNLSWDGRSSTAHLWGAANARGTMIWIHGGSFFNGSGLELNAGGWGPIARQASRGWNILALDYPVPNRFPGAVLDAAAAVNWVRANLGTPNVIIAGHSAGGTIAALVGTRAGDAYEGITMPTVNGWVSIAGILDYDEGSAAFSSNPGNIPNGNALLRAWLYGPPVNDQGVGGTMSPADQQRVVPLRRYAPSDPPGLVIQAANDPHITSENLGRFSIMAANESTDYWDLVDKYSSGAAVPASVGFIGDMHWPINGANVSNIDGFFDRN